MIQFRSASSYGWALSTYQDKCVRRTGQGGFVILLAQIASDSITELVSACRVGTTTVFSSILNLTLYKKRDNRCSD